MTRTKRLGLIAGSGRLPFMVADGARSRGIEVICAALADSAEPQLKEHTDVFTPVPLARPGSWIRALRRYGVTETIMVGTVAKKRIYTPFRILRYLPDWRAFRIWYFRLRGRDKKNDTLLGAIADELATGQIILEDSTMYCKQHLADEGVLTRFRPDDSVRADIEFGWDLARRLAGMDIGQAIAVREREVIAVEAIEGTAEMIKRAGALCRKGGWTLIKLSKPDQDMRFDVPCIGPETISSMKENRGRCIVVEKGKTIIIDKPETLALADKLKIAVIGH